MRAGKHLCKVCESVFALQCVRSSVCVAFHAVHIANLHLNDIECERVTQMHICFKNNVCRLDTASSKVYSEFSLNCKLKSITQNKWKK